MNIVSLKITSPSLSSSFGYVYCYNLIRRSIIMRYTQNNSSFKSKKLKCFKIKGGGSEPNGRRWDRLGSDRGRRWPTVNRRRAFWSVDAVGSRWWKRCPLALTRCPSRRRRRFDRWPKSRWPSTGCADWRRHCSLLRSINKVTWTPLFHKYYLIYGGLG